MKRKILLKPISNAVSNTRKSVLILSLIWLSFLNVNGKVCTLAWLTQDPGSITDFIAESSIGDPTCASYLMTRPLCMDETGYITLGYSSGNTHVYSALNLTSYFSNITIELKDASSNVLAVWSFSSFSSTNYPFELDFSSISNIPVGTNTLVITSTPIGGTPGLYGEMDLIFLPISPTIEIDYTIEDCTSPYVVCFNLSYNGNPITIEDLWPYAYLEVDDDVYMPEGEGGPCVSLSPGSHTANLVISNYLYATGDVYTLPCVEPLNFTLNPPLTLALTPTGYLGCDRTKQITICTVVEGGTPGYTYEWSPGDGLSSTTGAVVVLDEGEAEYGQYIVTVTDDNGCTATAVFSNYITDCCDRYLQAPYVEINQAWINSQMILQGTEITFPPKCYVTQMLTIPHGIRVNINNCEVVFADEKAGIRFSSQSWIDAQHSEFKPCEPTAFWAGLFFDGEFVADFIEEDYPTGGNKGVIHECVFTQAALGVAVFQAEDAPCCEGNMVAQLDILNNEFFDCFLGTVIVKVNFYGSISGNAYHHTVYATDYLDALELSTGILMYKSNLHKPISDNRFTIDEPVNGPLYRGILALESSFSVINNEFTNMYRCMDLFANNDPVTFESNNIQYTGGYNGAESNIDPINAAVRISANNAMVSVIGNEMNNLRDGTSVQDLVAVCAVASDDIEITDNKISGFYDAINLYNCGGDYVAIGRNTISSFQRYGIAAEGSSDLLIYWNDIKTTRWQSQDGIPQVGINLDNSNEAFRIHYNTINMEGIRKEGGNPVEDYTNYPGHASSSIGINFETHFNANSGYIAENCIHETGVAINFNQVTVCGEPAPCGIPHIKNNYLYNYVEAGIRFNGIYGGFIGGANDALDGGRNMFVSNYLPEGGAVLFGNAVDVAGPIAGTVHLWGNSEVLHTSGNVNVEANTITSTASCGNYVGNEESEGGRKIDPMLYNFRFQNQYEKNYPIELNSSDYTLKADYRSELNKVSSVSRLAHVKSLYGILDNNEDYTLEVDKLVQFVNANSYLTAHDNFMFNYYVATQKDQWLQAETMLNNFVPSSNDDVDFVVLQRIEIGIGKGQIEPFKLSEVHQALLADIDNRRGKYAAQARDLLNMTTHAHDYIFTKIPDGNYHYEFKGTGKAPESFMSIYPNPATDRITIQYLVTEDLDNAELSIVNVLGEKVVVNRVYA
ncbi:MAG: hypothetical protein V4615_08110, partial [Bacteroidota bacterium]